MTSPTSALQDLRDGRFTELQTRLSGVQSQFERGRLSEAELHAAFAPFSHPDPALGDQYTAWMQASPGSYAAHVALTSWTLARATALRGSGPMNRVSDLAWRGTLHFLEQADACARHAVTLTSQPLSAWLLLGRLRNLVGCQVSLEDVQAQQYPDWFARPLAKHPRSLELRRVMLDHLRPEWGGGDEEMFTFVRQQEAQGKLSEAETQQLWAEYHVRMAHWALHFGNHLSAGLERAVVAAEMDEAHAWQLFVALTRTVAPDAERLAALERALAYAEAHPDAPPPPETFFWALYNSDRFLEPLLGRVTALLGHWADAGHHAAATALGRLTLLGRQWQLPDPRPQLVRARQEGSLEAAETLVQLQEEGLGVRAAITDNPEKRIDVLQAAELGSPEMSWRVYRDFAAYRDQFALDPRQQYRYLLRAADTGQNDARFLLAQELRAGSLEVGDDGVLRPVSTQPLQQSLDYARHLLERAAAEEHAGAARALRAARESDWNSATARRLRGRWAGRLRR